MFERLSEKTSGELTRTIYPLGQLLGARAFLGGIEDGADDLRKAVGVSNSDRDLIASYAKDVGVDNYADHIDHFNEALMKWQAIVDQTGHDREAFAQALWDNVYSKID